MRFLYTTHPTHYAFQRASDARAFIRSIHQVIIGCAAEYFDMSLHADGLQKSQAGHLKCARLNVLRLLEHSREKPALIDIGDLRIARNKRLLYYSSFKPFP